MSCCQSNCCQPSISSLEIRLSFSKTARRRTALVIRWLFWPQFIDPDLWPPNSPDLNPVDYKVWGVMQERVYQTSIHNVDDLKWRLIAAWSGMQQSVIDKAIDQWRVRLRTCVKANGQHSAHLLWLSWLVFACFVSVFCLDSYLTLPSNFGVYHCECQSDLLLVLQGTVGAQKIGVVGNTI